MRPCQIACLMVSVLVLCLAAAHATPALQGAQDGDTDAQERWFFWSDPEPCSTKYGRTGTCYSNSDCKKLGGVSGGGCGVFGWDACCIKAGSQGTYTCNSETSDRDSVFANPEYPSEETSVVESCAFTVNVEQDICQLRLDLTEFTLADPDGEGQCTTDYLEVTGGTSTIPQICGVNDGQHLYVDVSPGSSVDINVVTGSVGEKWSIDVTQIACNSADSAPTGCLQYYTDPTGTLSSFNYNPSDYLATRQLADQSYGICFKDSGYCSVTFEQADGSSFSLDSNPGAVGPNVPPTPLVDADCRGDYLLIPGSTIVDNSDMIPPQPTTADRFCGHAFPGATTSIKPFIVNFITDSDESSGGDSFNEGFQLSYTLNACR